MRHRLPLLMALMSCCCILIYTTACGLESEPGLEIENPSTTDDPDDAKPVIVGGDQAPASTPSTTTPPTIGPGPVGQGGGGGGGGSQGGQKHADTGNPDNDPSGQEETICFDGLDNDNDGAIDCADPNCIGNSCNDGSGCTTGDVCTAVGVCEGTEIDCDIIVGNECSFNECVSISSEPGDNNFKCNSILDPEGLTFGSCTPSDNCSAPRNADGTCPTPTEACIVGRCIEVAGAPGAPPIFSCEGADRATLPTAEGGCFDGNPCHTFDCEAGACDTDILDGVFCDDDNECTGMGICNLGVCEAAPLGECLVDTDCPAGTPCIGVEEGTCSQLVEACTSDADCTPNTCTGGACIFGLNLCDTDADCAANLCEGATAGLCGCNDENDCTTDDACDGSGECLGEIGTQTCDSDDDCQSGTCVEGLCACSDDNDCTTADLCNESGQCVGTAVDDECDADEDCGIGSTCEGETPGICIPGLEACFTADTCASVGALCLGGSLGACSCDDDIACTANTCSGGACEIASLEDEACVTDEDPCTMQLCTEDGCQTTLMDGDMLCTLVLASLSTELDTIIGDAGLDGLECNIGRLICTDGDASDCNIDEAFPPTCSEATLESACTIAEVTQDISTDVATAICEELTALLAAP